MTCEHCGHKPHLLHHDLTRARFVCRGCGHKGRWMAEPEWRAIVAVAIETMRGAAITLRRMADQADAEAA
jgi:transcription initiation factor TFIIIB Brf1 subunit/transcription initiation factor TFIIB